MIARPQNDPDQTRPAGRTKQARNRGGTHRTDRNPPDEQERTPNRSAFYFKQDLAQTRGIPLFTQSFCITPIRALFKAVGGGLSRYSPRLDKPPPTVTTITDRGDAEAQIARTSQTAKPPQRTDPRPTQGATALFQSTVVKPRMGGWTGILWITSEPVDKRLDTRHSRHLPHDAGRSRCVAVLPLPVPPGTTPASSATALLRNDNPGRPACTPTNRPLNEQRRPAGDDRSQLEPLLGRHVIASLESGIGPRPSGWQAATAQLDRSVDPTKAGVEATSTPSSSRIQAGHVPVVELFPDLHDRVVAVAHAKRPASDRDGALASSQARHSPSNASWSAPAVAWSALIAAHPPSIGTALRSR